ncbi:hypothetical protein AUK22_05305 [bacterium CG2_30_54_10]|nr:MAG: hypothetical protein AUK22_05305 [bacterium CG2_30_54_10]
MKHTLSRYRHIVWDWNGTILDDRSVCLEIINWSLKKRSLPEISLDVYLDIFEFPVINYYRKLGFDFEKEPFEVVGAEFILAYNRRMFDCPLQKGALELLDSIKKMGIPQTILSALNESFLIRVIEHFNLTDFFDKVWGLSDIYASGKIDLGRKMLEHSGVAANETLMIGDTIHDFETARALGIDCVLMAGGHNSISRLVACGVPVVKSLTEFL